MQDSKNERTKSDGQQTCESFDVSFVKLYVFDVCNILMTA